MDLKNDLLFAILKLDLLIIVGLFKITDCGQSLASCEGNAVCDKKKKDIEVSTDFVSFERYSFQNKLNENVSRY